ncbi:MAG: hypothetical protein NTV75_10890 [Bacteroidia bacterium]|nr:hypothetical protein [Bacteroidia bacterium]
MKKISILIFTLLIQISGKSQTSQDQALLSKEDFSFLKEMTKDVVERSRVYPNQVVSKEFGANTSGGVLIKPGGSEAYPSFWMRDYAMSIESGFIPVKEQKHMLKLTASRQCDQTWISDGGSMIPIGAIPDHIRIDDSKPIYFPGTYDYKGQGNKKWGMMPPYCDQYFFVDMAYFYTKNSSSTQLLTEKINGITLIDRLELAYRTPPTKQDGVLVYVTDDFRGVDYGFRDAISITGELCLTSILKYRASLELAELFDLMKNSDKAAIYRKNAKRLKEEIPQHFSDSRGMLVASTMKSKQVDVWSTAMATYYGILEGEQILNASRTLTAAYKKGILAKAGNIRHIFVGEDFSEKSAWEKSLVQKGDYQNGGYWGTPTGWVCYTMAKTDPAAAKQLAKEYIDNLRAGDFRKGGTFGEPWECYNNEAPQNSIYMTTVTSPYIVFKK